MFERCFQAGEFKQALGIAIESKTAGQDSRVHRWQRCVLLFPFRSFSLLCSAQPLPHLLTFLFCCVCMFPTTDDVKAMLAYCFDLCHQAIANREFRFVVAVVVFALTPLLAPKCQNCQNAQQKQRDKATFWP